MDSLDKVKRRLAPALVALGSLLGLGLLLWFRREPLVLQSLPGSSTSPVRSGAEGAGSDAASGSPSLSSRFAAWLSRAGTAPAPAPLPLVHGRIGLRILCSDGRPRPALRIVALGDARVYRDWERDDPAAPSSEVWLEVTGAVQRVLILPEDPDLAFLVQDFSLQDGQTAQATLILAPGHSLSGTALDSQGLPVPGAWAEVQLEIPPDPRPVSGRFVHQILGGREFFLDGSRLLVSAMADKAGNFRLPNLPDSVSKVRVLSGRREMEQYASGEGTRVLLPVAQRP